MTNTKSILETDGLIRLPDVLKVIPVSRSTWLHNVKAKKWPQPVKLGPRMVAWKVSDIRDLIEELAI